jgi:hypothetical protein
MPRHGDGVELDEMLRRLKKLKEKFPDDAGKGGAGKEDDFNDLEDSFLRRISNVQEMIKNIGAGSDTKSITEQIRQKRNVHNELQGIADIMKRMGDMIEKERRRKKKKVSDEEMQRRETNFQSFQQLLKKVQDGLRKEKAQFGELDGVAKTTLSREDLFSGSGNAGLASRGAGIGMTPGEGGGGGGGGDGGMGGISAAQQQTLLEIQQRDQEQDLIIEEIGKLIEEAGQIAETIHQTVEIQNKMLDDVEKNIDTTQSNLTTVNVKLRKTLEAKGMSWERMCVLFFCMVFILGIVGVIVSGL